MQRQTQLELARVLQAHVKNGSTALAPEIYRNPVAAYSDPDRARLEHAIKTVLEEDFALGERMQRGFMSGLQTEVVYGRNEPALIHFHQRLRAALS